MCTQSIKFYMGAPPQDSINHLFWNNLLFMLFMINFRCCQLCPQGLSTLLPGFGACPLLFYVNIFLFSVNSIKNKIALQSRCCYEYMHTLYPFYCTWIGKKSWVQTNIYTYFKHVVGIWPKARLKRYLH